MFERLFRQKRTRIELDLTDAQIDQLRTVVDGLPLDPYAALVFAVLKALPYDHESAVCPPSDADARPPQNISERGRGFSLTARTPKGEAMLPEIQRVLSQLPHGSDL